ncbi:hypothetical protein [Haladaptatus sp. NG-SE-30]
MGVQRGRSVGQITDNPVYVTDKAEIVIDATPEEIWEYVTDPVHWTASNPDEHYGLEYDMPDNGRVRVPHSTSARRSPECTPTCMVGSPSSTIRM